MGVSAHDIFGDAAGAQPATPGSYGDAPSGYRLPEGTRLGRVRLQIADLVRSLAYYEGTRGSRGSRSLDGVARRYRDGPRAPARGGPRRRVGLLLRRARLRSHGVAVPRGALLKRGRLPPSSRH